MSSEEQTMQMFLLIVVVLGTLINALMLKVAIRRWFRLEPELDGIPSEPKSEIARLTLKRTIRLEACFFVGQTARLVHTLYVVHVGGFEHAAYVWTVFERSLVTCLLVYISIADLMTRNRIAKLIGQLPGGTYNWLDV